jgi:glucose/arabinose dehydrogenase
MRRRLFGALSALSLAGGVLVTSAPAAQARPHVDQVQIVADHLNNPRQIATSEDAVYVAEAGTGGPTCFGPPDAQACVGFTGSVTKAEDGHQRRIQTGLLSISAPEGDVVGVDALAFKGERLYGIATGTCGLPADAPKAIRDQIGQVLRLDGGNRVTAVGDASTFECTHDPDGLGPDTDPYGLAAKGDAFFVADAAGNDVVKIRHGVTSLATVLSTPADPQQVPTSLAWGPDGALYIGTLDFEAGPGGAKVYRYDTRTGATTVYAEGLTAITGIAFGHHGALYVSEWTTGFDQNGPSPNGDIVVVPKGGGTAGHQILGQGSLHFPGGVAVNEQGVYVSNWSIAPAQDSNFGPGNHGQLVRISRGED